MRTSRVATGALALAVALGLGSTASATPNSAPPGQVKKFQQAVSVPGIMEHERALQRIANENGGTRAASTPGNEATIDYIVDTLEAAGYSPVVQRFTFPFFQETAEPVFEQTSPNAKSYDSEFATMDYSGSGNITAAIEPVDLAINPASPPNTSTSGCEAADFGGFTAGDVALLQRGTCSFAQKAENAEAAGAAAVIIFNEGQPDRTYVLLGTLGEPVVTIPVIGTSFAVGQELAGLPGATVRIATETVSEERETANVIADTPRGDPHHIVVTGAHNDSVLAGPGINDDGSGTSTQLEMAEELMEQHIVPRNKIRFAFWGAEEEGLLGSQYYVDQLSPDQIADISVMLDFDMLASPNYVRFVYDGDGSNGGPEGPAGSGQVEAVFNDFFASRGLATEPTPFDGRSDYVAFTNVGIPAGGVFTGAEGIKTAEEAAIYGGTAGQQYDPCYHQACDTINNVNAEVLDVMSDAAATALITFADSKAPVTQTRSRPGKSPVGAAQHGPDALR